MTDSEFHEILLKYNAGLASQEEKIAVENFYKKNQEKIVENLYSIEEEKYTANRLKKGIFTRINDEEKVESRFNRRIYLKVAASIVLAIAAGLWIFNITTPTAVKSTLITKETQRGQRTLIELPDGSIINLNSESSVSFASSFKDSEVRKVTLTGEAFFEVVKNAKKPFIVETEALRVQVLGTSFNITSYSEENEVSVAVATGKVQVNQLHNLNSKSTLFLQPGEQALFNKKNERITKNQIDLQPLIAWKNNEILFNDIPLKTATQKLERWFNVSIDFREASLGSCHINGSYSGDESIINILESMEFVSNISYKWVGEGKILITGNSCQD